MSKTTKKPAPVAVGDRVRALRQRRQDLGLQRLELWVHPDDVQAVKRYAARMQSRRTADEL